MKKALPILSLLLCLALALTACSSTVATTTSTTKSQSTTATSSVSSATTSAASTTLNGVVKFGVIAPLTGTNSMFGLQIKNGAELAMEYVNKKGGILGKELKLVYEDEIDNQQASVNAMTKLMEYPDVVAFYGSTASGNCVAISPTVQKNKIPMIAGGSSANIPKQNNPYMWQTRITDDKAGGVLAKVATNTLKMKNPAILYSTESFGTGLKDQTVAALAELGIKANEKFMYGYVVDEKDFSSLITQIQNSGCDGLIAIGQQKPAMNIVNQVSAAGLTMPLLGSASFTGALLFQNCGPAANGWYASAEWVPTLTTDMAKKLVADYRARFNADVDGATAYTYDSVLLFAEACRIANSTTDREAINKAFEQIKSFQGAMSTYTYSGNHSFASTLLVIRNENQKMTVVESIQAK